MLIIIVTAYAYVQIDKKAKLDQHYFRRLKGVKEKLMYGSLVDTREQLEKYEDQTELFMHLDGYNDKEILRMKCNAIIEVCKEHKN